MREICTSGSEGGAAQPNEPSLPLSGIMYVDCSKVGQTRFAIQQVTVHIKRPWERRRSAE